MKRPAAYTLVKAFGEKEPDFSYNLCYAPDRRNRTTCPDGFIEPVTGAPSFPLIGKVTRWERIEAVEAATIMRGPK